MRVLGIDPGLGTIGFGLLEVDSSGCQAVDWGVITTTKGESDSVRLEELYTDMLALMHHTQPDVVSIEKIFYFRNVTTMVPVCQARGVILLAIQQANKETQIPVFEYTPMQMKQAITGYGKAKKREVQDMIQTLLELEKAPSPDDAADGLGLAYCHFTSHVRTSQMMGTV